MSRKLNKCKENGRKPRKGMNKQSKKPLEKGSKCRKGRMS